MPPDDLDQMTRVAKGIRLALDLRDLAEGQRESGAASLPVWQELINGLTVELTGNDVGQLDGLLPGLDPDEGKHPARGGHGLALYLSKTILPSDPEFIKAAYVVRERTDDQRRAAAIRLARLVVAIWSGHLAVPEAVSIVVGRAVKEFYLDSTLLTLPLPTSDEPKAQRAIQADKEPAGRWFDLPKMRALYQRSREPLWQVRLGSKGYADVSAGLYRTVGTAGADLAICPLCGRAFERINAQKVFCSPYCRTTYNRAHPGAGIRAEQRRSKKNKPSSQ